MKNCETNRRNTSYSINKLQDLEIKYVKKNGKKYMPARVKRTAF